MTTASLNFTGRSKIGSKQFRVSHDSRRYGADDFKLVVTVESNLLKHVYDTDALVLDLINRGDHERFILDSVESQTVLPAYFKPESRFKYRLSIVDVNGNSPGRIKKSSQEFSLVPPPEDTHDDKNTYDKRIEKSEITETFFNPIESDAIGGMLWKVNFQDVGEVEILINSRLLAIYSGDKRHPFLRGFMFPAIVAEVFSGLFMRVSAVSDLAETETEKWFKWAQFIMNEPMPDDQFFDDGLVAKTWLDWLERLLDEFSGRPAVGSKTFLDAMEDFQ